MRGAGKYAQNDLHDRIAAFLADCEAPHDLTQPLLGLAQAGEPAAKLALTGALYQLLVSTFSLDDQSRPQPAQLATFLNASLFTPIEQSEGEEEAKLARKAAVADAVLDVAWQLDQQVETLVPLTWERLHPATVPPAATAGIDGEEVKMVVDQSPAATPTSTPASAPQVDRKAESDRAVTLARQRLAAVLRALVDSGHLPQRAVLERLDISLINPLALLADSNTFQRLEIRARTALYYRQQKFNLLREESEGYSKFIVELMASLGPAHSVLDGTPQESEAERGRRAESVNNKVKTLIGNFDLDPSRTLDVLLDVFSDNVVEHWQFFLDVLLASPWAPKRRPDADVHVNGVEGLGKGKQPVVDVGLEREQGSDIIAQILGFKFAYYQRQGAPAVPQGLYTMAALLIWHGIVKLTDLWLHLSPSDDDLVKLESKWRDEQAQLARNVGGANALALAGALTDDDVPMVGGGGASAPTSSTTKASTSTAPAQPPAPAPNQKVGLLRSLLAVGDVTHSFFILGQFPFLVGAFPDVADLLNRLASVSVAPAYAAVSISGSNASLAADFKATRARVTVDSKGEKTVTPLAKTFALTADPFPSAKHDWTYFFPRWRERVPLAGDFAEVVTLLEEMYLPLVKALVARQPSLLTKLLRLAAADLGSNPSDHPRRTNWLDLLRTYLVPSISILEHYPSAALEVWKVLSVFPIETRFQIYGEWKDVHYRRDPALAIRKAEAERDVKSLLRRLSTENVKKLGKTFARIAHTNPTVIFGIALNQVQSYDNLIIPVVEACRYLTDLGYDVMAYSILDALSSSRPKTKEDGTSIAMWLQGLATFTGHVYRRWVSMQPSLWVILQYLVNQLVSGNSKDLVVLRELISRMTAIEPFADLSDAQVASLAGGKYLRGEVFQKTEIAKMALRGQQDGLAKAKVRLASALLGKDLAVPLLVNIALQRQACLKTDAHLKSLGALFDQNHAILFQYTELLLAIADPDRLAKLVPPVEDLLERYKLDAGVAFDIARPRLRAALREYDEKEAAELASSRKKQGLLAKLAREKEKVGEAAEATSTVGAAQGEDMKMEEVKPANEAGTLPPATADTSAVDAEEAVSLAIGMDLSSTEEAPVSSARSALPSNPWHPGLAGPISRIQHLLPVEAQTSIGAGFFVTFWQLTLYDIVYPKERYDAEINRLKLLQREASAAPAAKADDRRVFVDSVMAIANGLVEEAAKHLTARSTVNRRLNREKAHWFTGVKTKADRARLVDYLLQYCIQPRARMSLPDATFAYQMIKRLHSMNTPHFHTIVLYNRLLSTQISPVLYSCTENEARNYGLFLYEVLSDLYKWYQHKDAYQSEAIGAQLAGFQRNLADQGETRFYEHVEYQSALVKWHGYMVQGFIESFESAEYMHIKNSILVLTKVAPYFPLDYAHGSKLDASVTTLLATEKREDLKILAQGYKAVLTKRRKDWVNRPASAPATPAEAEAKAASPAVAPARSSLPTARKRSRSPPSAAVTPASNGAPNTSHSSLPIKPDARSTESDTKPVASAQPSTDRSRVEPSVKPREGLSLAERLKQEALASKRTAPAPNEPKMDPPRAPTPSRTAVSRQDRNDYGPRSAAASRPNSPRASDSERERKPRDDRDARDMRDGRDARDSRDSRSARDTRDPKDSRDGRDSRDARDVRNTRDSRDPGDGRDLRNSRDTRDGKDPRDARDARGSRDSRDAREARDAVDGRDSRDARDAKDGREVRERERSVESSHSSRASRSDAREAREPRDPRDARSARDARDTRFARDTRDEKRSNRDDKLESPRATGDSRADRIPSRTDEGRDVRAGSDRPRRLDTKEPRSSQDDRRTEGRESKDDRRSSDRDRRADDRSKRDADKRDEPVPSASRRDVDKREDSASSLSRRTRDADRTASVPTVVPTGLADDDSRHPRRRVSDRKMTREEEAREAEKERQRERDRQREAEREQARERERQRDAEREAARDQERKEARGRRFQAPASPTSRNGLPPKPTLPGPTIGAVDRLRPAPADSAGGGGGGGGGSGGGSSASLLERARASLPGGSTPPSTLSEPTSRKDEVAAGAEEFSIKGRGRLFQGLTSGSVGGGGGGGGGGGRRDHEDSSRKRLADRLGPEEPKRPRMDEHSGRGERRSRR
ncbi:hypothetical protein JCM3774_000827 [Rhodotorula dairenensis]